jgi:hypothetical protein
VLVFDDVLLLTYNATSLIIPGAANKTTAAGDACMIISEGSGNWKIVGYFAISGGGGGGGITALTGDVTASGTGSVAATIAVDAVDIPMLSATGTPDSTTFLRGDNTWATPSGATPTGYYAMYQSLVTQTAASSNTGYPMIFGTMDLTNQVTVVNNGSGNPTRITFANAGIYNLQFSSQFQNTDNAGHDVTIWIRLNGTDVAGSSGFVQVPARKNTGAGNEGHIITGWNYLLDVAAGDYYEIVWSTTDHTEITMQFYAAGSPPPSTASVIFTVTQQAGIMAGTGITSINSLTGAAQTIATGTSGTDFAVVSSGTSHSLNLPDASASARGVITTGAQTLAGIKTFGNGASAGEIRLLEGSGDGTNYVAIKAQAMGGNYTLTLPTDDGASAQVLQTDGAGLLSWVNQTPSAGISRVNATTAGTTITGTTAKTKTISVLVPANTFGAGTILQLSAFGIRTAGTTNGTMRIEVNTSDAIGGTLLANYVYTGSNSWFKMQREFIISNSTTDTSGYPGGTGALNDNAAVVAAIASNAIDWTVNQYVVVSMQNGNIADSTFCRAISILQK